MGRAREERTLLPRASGSQANAPSVLRAFLEPNILDVNHADFRANLERRGARLGLGRTRFLTVDLVFQAVALDDDFHGVPFAFLDVFALLVSRNDVELATTQEEVVVAFRTGLEVELDVHV